MSRKRQPPTVRRALIVDAARTAIIRDGLHHTGLRDIAAEAEVSVGTVTYHFNGIHEILLEAAVLEMDRFYAPLLESVEAEPDAAQALRLLIDPLFDGSEATDGHWRFWSDYWTASAREPDLGSRDQRRLYIWHRGFERTIVRGIDQGLFDAAANPLQVALKVAAYSDGIATQLSMGVPGLDHTMARIWLYTFLSAELGADFTVRD